MADPYGTARLRERVLAAWTASPARFREDANAEEDYALGGYRDRVIVELAQNAADAAARADVPGRLLLRLRGGTLTAANTGAPLDAAGVEALSTLRASAKRDREAVGRFGVGFSAVVAVSDDPAIASAIAGKIVGQRERPHSSPGMPDDLHDDLPGQIAGVMWSAAHTRRLVAGIPELAAELERRHGHVPVLRLPFSWSGSLAEIAGKIVGQPERGLSPVGLPDDLPNDQMAGQVHIPSRFDTVVRLPLRDAEAADLVRHQLDDVGPALMLALPALERIEIDVNGAVRTLTAAHGDGTATINGATWRTVEAHGDLAPELLVDRPTEERYRPSWQLRWATTDDPSAGLPPDIPAVLHAPTPSAEPLGFPALLIASFPMAPDRRHVASGPLTDFLVERAADAYIDLLRGVPATPKLLELVPGPVPTGALDARLRRAIQAGLPDTPLLPVMGQEQQRIRGKDAVAVDGLPALVELLADVLSGLLPPGWPVRHPALTALGVRRMELTDVVDALGSLDREPGWWRGLYEALAGADLDSLGALPVPLADGRLVRGPRGLLIAADDLDPAPLGVLGLRFVHPDAAHRLLVRLGAVEAGPRAVLTDPAVQAAVAGSYDADAPEAIADAVLTLVAAARLESGERPWPVEPALPGEDGELYPAGELLLPDAPLRSIVAADSPFGVVDSALVKRYGAGPLESVGVLRTFALVREQDVPLAELDLDLDDQEAWADDVLARLPPQDFPPVIPALLAVRDLELVERWDLALDLLAEPPLRAALVELAHVLLADGRRVAVPSYTAWWLRRHPVLGGRRPDDLRSPDADPMLADLYDPAPAGVDPELLRALGVRMSLAEVLVEPGDLLARLADPARAVSRVQLRELWTALARAGTAAAQPDRVRAVVDGDIETVPAADALVLDNPALLPMLRGQPLVIAAYELAAGLAELLDLALASEEIPGEVDSIGTGRPVPEVVRAIVPGAPPHYRAHDPLLVAGRSVPWWCEPDGTIHVGPDEASGLARGLAWASGRWSDRLLIEAVLRSPETAGVLIAEADLEA